MVTECLRTIKVTIFALGDKKVVLVSHEKYETLSINVKTKTNPSTSWTYEKQDLF